MYVALQNTILTKSALKKLSYDSMREVMGKEIGQENVRSTNDFDLLEKFHEGELI